MTRTLFFAASICLAASAAWPRAAALQTTAASAAGPRADATAQVRTALDRYCVGCHNQRLQTGGVTLDRADVGRVADDPATWERVVRKVQARTMPPQGVPRPDDDGYQRLAATLVAALDASAAAHPDPGRAMLRRLNRTEYGNAVRDLLAIDVDVAALLPPDDSAYGFDNVADVLNVSASLQERYLSAAAKVSAWAVGDLTRGPVAETYRVRQDLSQNAHLEGLPLGTVGGLGVRHYFPLDGEYTVRVTLQTTNFGNIRGLDYPHDVETVIDGARVHLARIGGDDDLKKLFEAPLEAGAAIEARLSSRVRVQAGARDVGVAFVRFLPLGDTRRLQPFLRSSADTLDWTGLPHVQSLTITGPFDPTGPGDTPSRRRLFTCRPTVAAQEPGCARQILATLARRAYRAPVTDAEVGPLLALYREGRAEGTFETGIQQALQAILASPRFVFRPEREPAGVRAGEVYDIGDIELASRLSFFLWSSLPDDQLLRLAEQGRLHDRGVLSRQVTRMLADPRSAALVANFAGQWLQLRNVKSIQPNSDVFPDFDDSLRQSMRRETELLFESIIREDRSVLDLLRADYTFLNERLARHYGVPGVYGSRFRRVPVTDEARRGLLGQGSILALTSHAERTSPVVRGKWVLDNILGAPPPPPPPNVPALPSNESGQAPKTMRELLAAHRANPVCASCHKLMDPIGFALENFDAVGAWRSREPGGPIDARGQLADGSPVDGVVTLRRALLSRPELFAGTMTEKMFVYALGRGIDHRDMPAVRAVIRQAGAEGYRFSAMVRGIVESAPFRQRTGAGRPAPQVAAAAGGRR